MAYEPVLTRNVGNRIRFILGLEASIVALATSLFVSKFGGRVVGNGKVHAFGGSRRSRGSRSWRRATRFFFATATPVGTICHSPALSVVSTRACRSTRFSVGSPTILTWPH